MQQRNAWVTRMGAKLLVVFVGCSSDDAQPDVDARFQPDAAVLPDARPWLPDRVPCRVEARGASINDMVGYGLPIAVGDEGR